MAGYTVRKNYGAGRRDGKNFWLSATENTVLSCEHGPGLRGKSW